MFGPSNPLFQLVATASQLPDVLTRLIVQYASPLYPRQAHYAGNIITTQQTRLTYTAPPASSSFSSPSQGVFSLSNQSWSVSGWMKRAVPNKPQFLLSVFPSLRTNSVSAHLHIGYTCHPHGTATNVFTVGFYANDLDVAAPLIDVSAHHEWEHFVVTMYYAAADECGLTSGSTTGQRRLYRNGVLIGSDDCVMCCIDDCSRVMLGRYDDCHFGSFQGGLCDIRMYSRALSTTEVDALYTGSGQWENDSGEGGELDGLEVWWKMDGSAGAYGEGVVKDFSGKGRHAVIEGSPLQLSMTGGCDAQQHDLLKNARGAKRLRT